MRGLLELPYSTDIIKWKQIENRIYFSTYENFGLYGIDTMANANVLTDYSIIKKW